MEDKDHNDYLLFKKEQADQDHNVNKLDALALIHPRPATEGVAEEGVAAEGVAEEVVATSEAEMNASQDQPKSQRIKHTARKNVHYVRRSTRPHS